MKGESAAREMESVEGAILHEIELEGVGLGRIVEVKRVK